MYKVINRGTSFESLVVENQDGSITSIPYDLANTDYANFKREINEGTAELQNTDGKTMTAEQAKDFVKELP